MKKIISVLLVISLAIIAFAGCNSSAPAAESTPAETPAVESTPDQPETPAGKTWKIGFNNYMDSHEFCAKVSQGIREACEEYGVELLYSEAQMDGQKMIANTQSFIDQGVDLIIDFNWVPEIGATMLKMCQDAGVELISMDTIYEGTYYFGANSYVAGEVAGEYLAQKIKENWGGDLDAFVGMYYMGGGDIVADRVIGCIDKLKTSGINMPDDDMILILDAGASDQAQTARKIVTDFLTEHPDFQHVAFAANNDETGVGIFAGIEMSNRLENCYAVTTGGDTPFREHLQGGGGDSWICSTAFTPELYGEQVIPMAIDILEGKDVPMEVFLNHFPLTKDNVLEYYPNY